MARFFRTSAIWVVDFQYDGSARRWFKAFGPADDPESVRARMASELRDLHGTKARLIGVRRATEAEETAYLRGDEPKNVVCPTGRSPQRDAGS